MAAAAGLRSAAAAAAAIGGGPPLPPSPPARSPPPPPAAAIPPRAAWAAAPGRCLPGSGLPAWGSWLLRAALSRAISAVVSAIYRASEAQKQAQATAAVASPLRCAALCRRCPAAAVAATWALPSLPAASCNPSAMSDRPAGVAPPRPKLAMAGQACGHLGPSGRPSWP